MQSGGTNASGEFINGYYPAASGEPAAIGNFTLTGGTVSVLDGLEVGYGRHRDLLTVRRLSFMRISWNWASAVSGN